MRLSVILSIIPFILTWVHFTHCQGRTEILTTVVRKLIDDTSKEMADFKQKQNETLEILKGYGDLQQKQNDILAKLSGYGDLQQKQNDILAKLSEMHKKLGHAENTPQGAVNNTQDSLQSVDGCTQGKDECSPLATCRNSVGSYSCSCNPPSEGDGRMCSCPSGFAQKGSKCEDVDECAQGKDECSPLATCRNSVGSYSCSCNPPSEGDGQTCDIDECAQGKTECSPYAVCKNSIGSYSCFCKPPYEGDGKTCGFQCESPAELIEGLGCVKIVKEKKTWSEMNATCHREGWRLLEDLTVTALPAFTRSFSRYGSTWIGAYGGKWQESGIPLKEDLWRVGYQPDSARWHCGVAAFDPHSSLVKVGHRDCLTTTWGYCQLLLQ
ncbi:thrombospondin-4-like isoform X20 [Macrobrachium nipponense]|uniref:thrombospondin-4-like isoform X19 n=1 Tax=Macrobrachium nipponense TaxID=159736 RepID=UPI0030C8B369